MKYRKFGTSGLVVSAVTLGCMSYGDADRGNHGWTLPEEESRSFIKNALELGITTFDTANIYSIGSSEEILGRALKDFAKREEVVVATKVHGTMRPIMWTSTKFTGSIRPCQLKKPLRPCTM